MVALFVGLLADRGQYHFFFDELQCRGNLVKGDDTWMKTGFHHCLAATVDAGGCKKQGVGFGMLTDNDPNARATFIGMTMDTTRADMTQAVLEGVAFALRDSLEVARSLGISIERTKICGGGAKSPLWKKIIANVLNIKVDVLANEEGPSMGGAMLAAVACGEYANVEEAAAKIVKVVDTVETDTELAAKYEARYQQFKQIYPACKPIFSLIR